jgi:hypothetical protein
MLGNEGKWVDIMCVISEETSLGIWHSRAHGPGSPANGGESGELRVSWVSRGEHSPLLAHPRPSRGKSKSGNLYRIICICNVMVGVATAQRCNCAIWAT